MGSNGKGFFLEVCTAKEANAKQTAKLEALSFDLG